MYSSYESVRESSLDLLFVPFTEWRRSHAASLAAWCLTQLRGVVDDPRPDIAEDWLARTFQRQPGDSENRPRCGALSRTTPYALTLLSRIPRGGLATSLQWLPPAAEFHLQRMTTPDGARPSIQRGAKIIAQLILDGVVPADAVIEISRTYVSDTWRSRRETDFAVALQSALPVLRARPGVLEEKLKTLTTLRAIIMPPETEEAPWRHPTGAWPLVEAHILDSLLVWPLLAHEMERGDGFGFSLPLAVDGCFKPRTGNLRPAESFEIAAPGKLGRLAFDSEWVETINSAGTAARDLWRMESGHLGPLAIDRVVNGSTLRLDLSPAEAILASFAEAERGDPFLLPIKGRSAGPAIALAFFSWLKGMRYVSSFAITGMIENPDFHRITDEEMERMAGRPVLSRLNRRLAPPFLLDSKIRWLNASRRFDVLVTPPVHHEEEEGSETIDFSRIRPLIEVNFCKTLAAAADVAFCREWRRNSYVRCADLIERWGRVAETRDSGPEIECFLGTCAAASSPVLLAPADLTAQSLARALASMGTEDWRAGRFRELPPKLATTFVRLVPDERGDRLIGVLGEAVGADQVTVAQACSASNDAERARLFAGLLNCQRIDPALRKWASPDLMVFLVPPVIGERLRAGEALEPDWKELLTPILAPDLADALAPASDDRWRALLGRVRIILADDEAAAAPAESVADQKDGAPRDDESAQLLAQAAEILSVFRFEFTQQEASLLLASIGVRGPDVRSLLLRMASHGLVDQLPGCWQVSPVRGRAVERFPVDSIRDHLAAAVARAPYLASQEVPGLADSEARRLHRVHEAQFHVGRAIAIARHRPLLNDPRQQEQVTPLTTMLAMQARLACLFDVCGWGMIRAPVADNMLPKGYRRRAADILVAQAEARGEQPSIRNLLTLMRAYARDLRSLEAAGPTAQFARSRPEWRELAERLNRFLSDKLEQWVLLADTSPEGSSAGGSGTVADRVEMAALFSVLLRSGIRFPAAVAADMNRMIEAVVAEGPDCWRHIAPDWFEARGDAEADDGVALAWYERGIVAEPAYAQNWLKAFGCSDSSEEKIEQRATEFSRFKVDNPSSASKVVHFLRGPNVRRIIHKHPRYGRGYECLNDVGLI